MDILKISNPLGRNIQEAIKATFGEGFAHTCKLDIRKYKREGKLSIKAIIIVEDKGKMHARYKRNNSDNK